MASPPPNPNTGHVSPSTASGAVDALLKWIRARPDHQKAQLFEPDDLLHLVLTLKRIPTTGRTNPYRIPLPHPIHPMGPTLSLCLLADDRPNSPLTPSAALTRIQELSLPVTVIGLSDLKSDYKPYESRRKLADSHDLFFADRKILPLLPRLLGNHFFKKKKIPLAVDLSRPGWPEQIRVSCESTFLYLRTGTCSGVRIGRVSMEKGEIVENLMGVIEKAVGLVPKKWGNVRSMHLKSVESPALPIYEVVPEIGLKIEGVKKVAAVEEDGEVLDAEEGTEKKRKGRKKGRIHEAKYMDGDDGVEEAEDEKATKKRKKGRKDGKNGVEVDVDDGGELNAKKKIKKTKKKVEEDVFDAADEVNKKKKKKKKKESKEKQLEKKEGKKSKKSKLRLEETD